LASLACDWWCAVVETSASFAAVVGNVSATAYDYDDEDGDDCWLPIAVGILSFLLLLLHCLFVLAFGAVVDNYIAAFYVWW